MNTIESVHKLTLVLVNSLDLDIEEGILIDSNTTVLVDPVGKSLLVSHLDISPCLSEIGIILLAVKLGNLSQISRPVLVAEVLGVEGSKFGVTAHNPSSGGDTIGLVLELVREDLVEVLEKSSLEELRVDGSDTIDSV